MRRLPQTSAVGRAILYRGSALQPKMHPNLVDFGVMSHLYVCSRGTEHTFLPDMPWNCTSEGRKIISEIITQNVHQFHPAARWGAMHAIANNFLPLDLLCHVTLSRPPGVVNVCHECKQEQTSGGGRTAFWARARTIRCRHHHRRSKINWIREFSPCVVPHSLGRFAQLWPIVVSLRARYSTHKGNVTSFTVVDCFPCLFVGP